MKHERMCTVCKAMKDKAELFRVAKTPTGVWVDQTGKIQGRGAYICKTRECVLAARKIASLSRSLSTTVEMSVYDMLEDLVEDAK